jgi:hypothetical protein
VCVVTCGSMLGSEVYVSEWVRVCVCVWTHVGACLFELCSFSMRSTFECVREREGETDRKRERLRVRENERERLTERGGQSLCAGARASIQWLNAFERSTLGSRLLAQRFRL